MRPRRRTPAACCRPARCGGASCRTPTTPPTIRRSARRWTRRSRAPKPGPRASRSARTHGSSSAPHTVRASRSACSAANGCRPRVTASASRNHSSGRSSWTRRWTMRGSGSDSTRYYADIAPAVAKFLRFLLLLPGGDRVQGLKDMETVHERGTLLRGEADYQLHWIYLWYENQPKRALELLNGLRTRYPANPHLAMRAGEIEDQYFHDAGASLGVWQALAEGAARTGDPVLSEAAGRMGAAVQLNALEETDRGVAELDKVIAMAPARPFGARARARWLRGTLLDRLGQRQAAVDAYKAALADVPSGDPDGIADKARAGLRATPDPAAGEAYRTSLARLARLRTRRAGRGRCRAGAGRLARPARPGDPGAPRTRPAGARRRDVGAADLRRDHRGPPAGLTHRARGGLRVERRGVRSTRRSAGRARTLPLGDARVRCRLAAAARVPARARSPRREGVNRASHLQIDTRWTDTSQYGARMDARVGAGTNIIDARSLRSGVKS